VSEIANTLVSRLEHRVIRHFMSRAVNGADNVVVHIYGQEGLTPLLVNWARSRAVPLVYTESGEGDETYAERFGLGSTIRVVNDIPLVICCGPQVAANIRRVYRYTGHIAEVPFLIEDPDDSRARPEAPTRTCVVLGSVGRLVEHKRHIDIVSALAVLRREGHDVRFLLGGDGPMRPRIVERARAEGVEDYVEFVPEFDHVSDILDRMDVFVLPSTSEGQPLAITEAMAHGLPVVSTRFGGIPDQVQHGVNGLLVTPLAQEELLDALRALVTDGERRRKMGAAAREEFQRSRRSDVVLDAIEAAYGRVLATTAPESR
jgi:glycosyltransferase involved in cell wall biosynthesis